jgi:hypothetical protein
MVGSASFGSYSEWFLHRKHLVFDFPRCLQYSQCTSVIPPLPFIVLAFRLSALIAASDGAQAIRKIVCHAHVCVGTGQAKRSFLRRGGDFPPQNVIIFLYAQKSIVLAFLVVLKNPDCQFLVRHSPDFIGQCHSFSSHVSQFLLMDGMISPVLWQVISPFV